MLRQIEKRSGTVHAKEGEWRVVGSLVGLNEEDFTPWGRLQPDNEGLPRALLLFFAPITRKLLLSTLRLILCATHVLWEDDGL